MIDDVDVEQMAEETKQFNKVRALLSEFYFRIYLLQKAGRLISAELDLSNDCKIEVKYDLMTGENREILIRQYSDDPVVAHQLILEDVLKILPELEQ